MEKHNEILNELQGISPLIANIDKANVFSIPDGYFDSISNTVMLSIGEEFSVDKISDIPEDKNIPAGYFNNLSDLILDKIKKQETDELQLPAVFSTIKKDQPFRVPDNYFEILAGSVLNRIKSMEEQEKLPVMLDNLKGINPFTVNENYFEELSGNILRKVKQQPGAKIIAMPKRFPILRYAAAAVITGALALGIYKYSNQTPVNNISSNLIAAEIPDPIIETGITMNDQKFNETLNNLSADAIVNYLQKNSSEADIAVLSSNLEENSLPNEEDYLSDDKTLDNFLKQIESKTN
jgi:hypothetical protein